MSDINCGCGYNYTQTGCPNCKRTPIYYTKEHEQALANMLREYDKRGERIEELEAQLKTMIDPQVAENMVRVSEPMLSDALAAADKRIDGFEAELVKAMEALEKLAMAVDVDLIEQAISDVLSEGGTYRDAAEYVARTTLAELKGEQP